MQKDAKIESKEVKTNMDLSLEIPSEVFSAKMFNESAKASEDRNDYNYDHELMQSPGPININVSGPTEVTIKDE